MDLSWASGSIFFLSLLGYAFLGMLLLPRLKMGAALLSAFCGMLLAAYWLVIILQVMAPAAYGLMLGGLGALALGLGAVALNRRGMRSRVCSVALFGYLGLSLVFVLAYREAAIVDHDSYSFWMRAVRELFLFDSTYFNPQSNISHSDYNPIFAALQYCIVRVFGWQDAYLLYGIAAALVTSLCAVSDLIPKKAYGGLFLVVALAMYVLGELGVKETSANGPLAPVFFGGVICLCFRKDESPASLLPVLAVMAVLPALKLYSGLMFAMALLVVMLLAARKPKAGEGGRMPLRYAVLGCCLILLMEGSWSGFYHFQTRKVSYETGLAQAAFAGEAPAGAAAPVFQLSDLVSGNPRNESLAHALTPENTQKVLGLMGETAGLYFRSILPYAWLSLLPLLWILRKSKGALPFRIKTALWVCVGVFLCFTLGMFAGYYVQAEISGGAVVYLRTVSLPLVLLALFVCAVAAADRGHEARAFARVMMAAWVALAVIGNPVRPFLPAPPPQGEESITFASYTLDFFQEELPPLLLPQDAGSRALLMDSTWEASQIKSKSGITHAYQYYALPMRLSVTQYPYGDYDQLEGIDKEGIDYAMDRTRSNLLILRLEDDLYRDAFAEALEIETDAQMPWILDVERENGALTYTLRNQEEE